MKRISAAPEEADIVDLSHEGHGVARLDGKAVFVTDALPGERVVLRRVRRHRNFDEAVLESVLRASPDRVAPSCPHYGTCGGCALQHLSPGAQLTFKQGQLLENLARLGGVAPQRLLEPLAGPVWGYRLLRTGKWRTDWRARFGRTAALAPAQEPTLLIHAARLVEIDTSGDTVTSLRAVSSCRESSSI